MSEEEAQPHTPSYDGDKNSHPQHKKMGTNSPSLTDLVTLLDRHAPDVLLLTETPPLPHQGALTQVLRNIGYKTHYHPVNAPSPKDTLPEARLPTHTTHGGGEVFG